MFDRDRQKDIGEREREREIMKERERKRLMEEKEGEEVEILRENSKLQESWFAPSANYLFLCTVIYSSSQLR